MQENKKKFDLIWKIGLGVVILGVLAVGGTMLYNMSQLPQMPAEGQTLTEDQLEDFIKEAEENGDTVEIIE